MSTEYGWLLGKLAWGYIGRDVDGTASFLTVLRNQEIRSNSVAVDTTKFFTRVLPYADGYEDIEPGIRMNELIGAYKAVKQLCGSP